MQLVPRKANGATTPSERATRPMSSKQSATHKRSGTVGKTTLSASKAHELLSSTRRRQALRYIVERGEVGKSELIDAVATREYGVTHDELTHTQRKRVQISLGQAHLPKLEDYGVIATDGDTITTGPFASDVLAFDHDTRSGNGFLGRVVSTVTPR